MTKKLSRLTNILLRQHGAVLLLLHISLIVVALLLSWLLRYDFAVKNQYVVLSAIPILVLLRLAAMSRFNLLHGHWRYTGIEDATEILKAVAVGSIAFFGTINILLGVKAFPLSLFVIEAVVSGCLVAGTRIAFRVLAEAATHVRSQNERKQVLVIGAGFAGQMIIRELRSSSSGYWVVGCLDDDTTKVGLKILGKPVLGTVDQLAEIANDQNVDEILIAIPSATGQEMRRIVSCCEKAGVRFSTVPALNDLISGKSQINELRNVDLNDLLGREAVQIELESVRTVIEGKVVLVTGAAGSIGSELCRQILGYRPAKLVCLDQSETGLFYLQMELGGHRSFYCVADYTNPERMKRVFATHHVQLVFHAGAYKHVPLMEANPREALENNVFGLNSLLDVADRASCEAFILISSDKAVNPTSVMGSTKRIGELILGSRPNSSKMRCVSVRFGNVLGSQGSVVPVFQKQLTEQKRITVTDPDITRFFMTIQEAVSLVLQASEIGKHGDILVLDMGEPVRILDLARTLIRLSGKTEKEIEIVFTGLRPGEKLYEELFYPDELVFDTRCSKIKRTCGTQMTWQELRRSLNELQSTMFDISDWEVRSKIRGIVPQCTFGGLPSFAETLDWNKMISPERLAAAAGDD